MTTSNQIVKVNVGGRIFEAQKSTLTASGFLANLLDADLEEDQSFTSGQLFIDRDPVLFEEVLRLLRGYTFIRHARSMWQEIKAEADFYLVPITSLDSLYSPEVVVKLPPGMSNTRTLIFNIEHTKKNAHWLPRTSLPPDVKTYIAGVHGLAVDPVHLKELGFVHVGDGNHMFERKERIVYYTKSCDATTLVPTHPHEIERLELPRWTQVTYAVCE